MTQENRRAPVWRCSVLWLAVAVSMILCHASAQVTGTGNIQGTVQDPSGAVVPGATVTITDVATGVQHTAKTDSAGLYVFSGLITGTYNLEATAPGFQTYGQSNIVLEIGSSIAVNVALKVGSATTKVEVRSEGLALQTEDATFKQTIDQNEMAAMPLNGRHMTDLITLSGGASMAPAGDFTGSKYSYQTISLSVAGGGGNTTLWRLDGGDNQDYMGNGNLPYPFPDAVSEFSVESTAMGAQDGGHIGGMVNVVTQSGTNKYHGEAFEFIRNNYLDATNFFSSTPDTLHQNQFGGTFGGPIIRNKMFGFAAYQRTVARQTQSSTQATVPTAANLQGDFSATDGPGCEASGKSVPLVDPLTGATLSGDKYPSPPAFNPQALKLQTYLPKINPALDPNNCGYVFYTIPYQLFDNEFVTRVDYTVSSKQNIYGRYFIDGYQFPAYYSPTNILVTTQSGNIERTQSFVLGDSYTFSPNLVNSAHVTVLRRVDNRGYNTSDINANALGVDLYQAEKAGLQMTEGKWSIGGGTNSIAHFNDNTLSIGDDVTWVHGKHQFMFGGAYVRNQLNIGNAYESNGIFTFNGEYSGSGPNGGSKIGDQNLDFLMGTLSAFQQSKQQQNALRGPIPSLYIQDTYHAGKQLTVTAGLRWNPNFEPVDYFNRGLEFNMADFLANVHSSVYPNAPAGILYYGDPGVSRQFTNNSPWQFAPNVGISYDPTGSGKTVLRAGGELAYDNPNFFTAQRNQQNPPYATAISNTQTSGSGPLSFTAPWSVGSITTSPFPQPSVPTAAQAQFFAQSQYIWVVPHFKPAYTIQWTLSVQHEFGHGWQAQIDYIGNATRHDPLGLDIDPAVYIPGNWGPGGSGCAPIVRTGPAAVTPGAAGTPCSTTKNQNSRLALTIANPAQGNNIGGGNNSTEVFDEANASYNGLVSTIQHRLSNTFSLLANWTWSKCLDIYDAQGDYAGDAVENNNNIGMDWGPCGSDFRNIENVSVVAKSGFHGMNRFARAVVNNWELAPLMHIQSGEAFTVTAGGDDSLTGVGDDRPNLVPGVNPYHEVKFRKLGGEANREYLNPAAFAEVCPGNVTAGCAAAGTYGNIGRNSFHGPRFFQLDAQVSRIFPITERWSTTFRLEAFNALNHPNFFFSSNSQTQSLTSSTFGQISSTAFNGTNNTFGARVFQGVVKINF